MLPWSSAAHELWLSAAPNNHVAHANPLDHLAAVAAFVLEANQSVMQHHAGAPLDVASRHFQQRSRFQHNGGRPRDATANGATPVPATTNAGPIVGGQVAQPQQASPAGTQATTTTEGEEEGSLDVSPQDATEWDTAAISDSVGRAVSAAMSGQSPEGFW